MDAAASRLWYRPTDVIHAARPNISLRLSHDAADMPSPAHTTAIHFTAGDAAGFVTVPNSLITAVLHAHGVGNSGALEKEKTSLILEYWLSAALDELEDRLKCTITITELKSGPSYAGGLCARCSCFGRDYPIAFSLPLPLVVKLTSFLKPSQNTAHVDQMPVLAAIRIAVTELSLSALGTVRTNDILLADATPGKMIVLAVFGERFAARAQIHSGKVILLERPVTMAGKQREIFAMGETADSTRSNSQGDADMNDIVIKLTFELGRQEITVRDLRQLAPGYIFDLSRDVRTAVDIYAGQRRIGQGEMVQVNETLGVRVTRLFNNE